MEYEGYSGAALRNIREGKNISLRDIENSTKIRALYLDNIEHERFEVLPSAVFIRGYLLKYAKCLSLEPESVAKDYMSRYNKWLLSMEGKG